jgi:hypothetical protein
VRHCCTLVRRIFVYGGGHGHDQAVWRTCAPLLLLLPPRLPLPVTPWEARPLPPLLFGPGAPPLPLRVKGVLVLLLLAWLTRTRLSGGGSCTGDQGKRL